MISAKDAKKAFIEKLETTYSDELERAEDMFESTIGAAIRKGRHTALVPDSGYSSDAMDVVAEVYRGLGFQVEHEPTQGRYVVSFLNPGKVEQ